ncbi:MAG: cytochrome c oxidase subunit II [Alphaproteobacteria bacterium]
MPIFSHKSAYTKALAFFTFIALLLTCSSAFAGSPQPWGLNLQEPGSPVERQIHDFHDVLLWIISLITLFVLGLMIYVMVRYNKWTNPTPTMTTHNVKLEIVWTLLPCLILIGISLISFPLLYYADRLPEKVDLTLKVTGHQWYWSYEYPDNGNVAFDSHGIWDSSAVTAEQAAKLISESSGGWLIKGEPKRLLEVDNRVVLPVNAVVRVQIAAGDVEHSWFMPALGVNQMAVPGRLNEVWLKVDKEGLYYGQCSMICGNGHGYMPIVIEAVSKEKFDAWVKSKQTSVGAIAPTTQFAAIH